MIFGGFRTVFLIIEILWVKFGCFREKYILKIAYLIKKSLVYPKPADDESRINGEDIFEKAVLFGT